MVFSFIKETLSSFTEPNLTKLVTKRLKKEPVFSNLVDQSLKGDTGWLNCTSLELSEHIVGAHMNPRMMLYYGPPLFDVDVAYVKGICLQEVVDVGYNELESVKLNFDTESYTNTDLYGYVTGEDPLSSYTKLIITTLGYIKQRGLGEVNVDCVMRELPFNMVECPELNLLKEF